MRTALLLLIILTTLHSRAQIIRVANNNPNAPTGDDIFSTLQEAIDGANSGDIIQIIPSETNYGSGIVDRELAIYGIGFNPDKDLPLTSKVASITIQSAEASGTKLSGLVITSFDAINLAPNTGSNYTLSDVVIENCLATTISHSNSSNPLDNLQIRGNIIGSGIGNNGFTTALDLRASTAATSNVVISNNILYNSTTIGTQARGSINAANNTVITNNLFVGSGATHQAAFSNLKDCMVTNNIFYGSAPYSTGSTSTNESNVFTNNISFNTADDQLPPVGTGLGNTGSGNMPDVDPLIVSLPLSSSWSFTSDPSLGAMSPALDAGTDGTDIGISGFTFPFDITGAVLPVIQELNTNSLVNQGEHLEVMIKAKSAN